MTQQGYMTLYKKARMLFLNSGHEKIYDEFINTFFPFPGLCYKQPEMFSCSVRGR